MIAGVAIAAESDGTVESDVSERTEGGRSD